MRRSADAEVLLGGLLSFYLAAVALFVAAITAYAFVTQRVLHAAGKPASWVLALALGMAVTLAEIAATDLPSSDLRSRVWHTLIVLTGSSLPFLGAAAGLALTARESRSSRTQLGAALALGATASLAAPGIAFLLICLVTGDCL